MATFLFVHGAFHGGWCFDLVRPLLEGVGHTVLTPTLSGVGERSHLSSLGSINLETHILDIVNLIKWRDLQEIVLCGHSYGGNVITGVADQLPERIASLVYIDAMMPKHGDTVFSLLPMLASPFTELSAALGGVMVAPLPAAGFGVGLEYQDWVNSKLTPHPLSCFTQQIKLSGAYKKISRRILIYNSKDYGIETPIADWYEAERHTEGSRVFSLDGGHDLMVDSASELAEILLNNI